MSRYLYACPGCGRSFEIEKSMSQAAEPGLCPQCGQPGRRIFTAPAISIKGSPVRTGDAACEGAGCAPDCGSGCCHGECPSA